MATNQMNDSGPSKIVGEFFFFRDGNWNQNGSWFATKNCGSSHQTSYALNRMKQPVVFRQTVVPAPGKPPSYYRPYTI